MDKVTNFFKDNFPPITDWMKNLTEEAIDKANERMSICKVCDEYDEPIRLCKACHCIIPAKVLFPESECPLRKW